MPQPPLGHRSRVFTLAGVFTPSVFPSTAAIIQVGTGADWIQPLWEGMRTGEAWSPRPGRLQSTRGSGS